MTLYWYNYILNTLKEICDYYNIEFFASVFDEEKLEWCESLDVKLYKIASRTVVAETKLCLDVISKNKPVYISLGYVHHGFCSK